MFKKILWISTVFIILAAPLFGNTSNASVQLVSKAMESEITGEITYLSPLTKAPKKVFMDQSPAFIVLMPEAYIPAEATKVKAKVEGQWFKFDTIAPLMIQGLAHGEQEVDIQLLNAKGEEVNFLAGAKPHFSFKTIAKKPVFTNDAIVLGLLLLLLALIFWTEKQPRFKKFYRYIPGLLLCYFVPSIFNSLNIISGSYSSLYYVSSRYLLPAALILLCLSIDFKGIWNLGPKALIMFLSATVGIIIGGPVALFFILKVSPDLLAGNPEQVAEGLSTIAGSWIGGGANQTAMKEVFNVPENIFAAMVVVDVIVANIWMGFLLYGAGISDKMDRILKADNSAIEDLKNRISDYRTSIEKVPQTIDMFMILAVAFVGVALSHWGASLITDALEQFRPRLESAGLHSLLSSFFWIIVISTTYGLLLSVTKARKLEGVGASRWGSVFIYVLVATIGMKMNLGDIFSNPGLFAVGFVWMLIHIIILLTVAKIIRAPFFFVAVGSQANIGGAASAPIVASAFSPSLAPVGVLMAVLGYALGTYGAILCEWMMAAVAGG